MDHTLWDLAGKYCCIISVLMSHSPSDLEAHHHLNASMSGASEVASIPSVGEETGEFDVGDGIGPEVCAAAEGDHEAWASPSSQCTSMCESDCGHWEGSRPAHSGGAGGVRGEVLVLGEKGAVWV